MINSDGLTSAAATATPYSNAGWHLPMLSSKDQIVKAVAQKFGNEVKSLGFFLVGRSTSTSTTFVLQTPAFWNVYVMTKGNDVDLEDNDRNPGLPSTELLEAIRKEVSLPGVNFLTPYVTMYSLDVEVLTGPDTEYDLAMLWGGVRKYLLDSVRKSMKFGNYYSAKDVRLNLKKKLQAAAMNEVSLDYSAQARSVDEWGKRVNVWNRVVRGVNVRMRDYNNEPVEHGLKCSPNQFAYCYPRDLTLTVKPQ